MKYLIGIDLGTSATKSVLFREDGHVLLSYSVAYPMDQPKNGWAEQDPRDWWDAAVESLQHITRNSGIAPEDIAGVGIAGQMHGLVMLDEKNEVIRPAILWCDQRTGKECEQLTQAIGKERLVQITANPAMTGFTAAKILWVRNHEPQNFERCRHILLPKDYIRYKLTGEFATDVSDASGTQLLDVANRCWSEEVLQKLKIDKKLLGKVYESVDRAGTITAKAAAATGLMENTAVAAGAGDNAAAAVGVGVVEDNKAFTTVGSSGVVYAHTSEMNTDPKGRVHTFCSAVPGEWHVMGVTQAAGLSLKWFCETFCEKEKRQATEEGVDTYYIMDKEAEDSPIGCNKLIYLPYLMGERTPHLDPDCRGVFFGLSAVHQKKDMIRAVMEGVSYSLKDCLEILKEMKIEVSDMTACGGGGSSKLWQGMLSDIYNCPVKACTAKEGPALGAAVLAGVSAGVYSSVKEACKRIIDFHPAVEPRIENYRKYQEFYKIYRSLYPNLKNIYKNLADCEEEIK